MTLAVSTLPAITIVVLVLLVVVLFAAVVRGQRRPRRTGPARSNRRIESELDQQGKAIQRLEAAVRQLALGQKQLGELTEGSVRHIGVVRFDAFEDMGGRLSFSAALLDGNGDGVVITSINGRQDTRCYAKRVSNGSSVHNLTDEERQAIREALATDQRPHVAQAGG
jgi:Protein of unknown function (DUF4446)